MKQSRSLTNVSVVYCLLAAILLCLSGCGPSQEEKMLKRHEAEQQELLHKHKVEKETLAESQNIQKSNVRSEYPGPITCILGFFLLGAGVMFIFAVSVMGSDAIGERLAGFFVAKEIWGFSVGLFMLFICALVGGC